jgi:hypothetical protein
MGFPVFVLDWSKRYCKNQLFLYPMENENSSEKSNGFERAQDRWFQGK